MTTTATPAATATGTAYHVLREVANGGAVTYEPVEPSVKASSAAAAIRATVKTAGTYVAIPSRSFAPVKVTVETQTVVTVK